MSNLKQRFSIVIPFYNNMNIISHCFPSIFQIRKNSCQVSQIIAVDDNSNDGTSEWIKKNYPEVTVITNKTNLGFGKSCKIGIMSAENEWIILLNSDIQVVSDIISPLTEIIQSVPDLFQISFYSFKESGEKFEGQKYIKNKTGLFKTRNNFFSEYATGLPYETFYACGGHCLLSKSKFQILGGFSPVFEPFYWEDVDLSFRALKRGWKVLFEPRCRVIHYHRGSIRTSNYKRKIETIQTRNRILFFWKNISSVRLWLTHLSGLFFRILTSWIAGDLIFYSGISKAVIKIPQMLKERTLDRNYWKIKDHTLFKIGR